MSNPGPPATRSFALVALVAAAITFAIAGSHLAAAAAGTAGAAAAGAGAGTAGAAAAGAGAGAAAAGAGASAGGFAVPASTDQLIVVSSPTYDPPAPGYLARFQTFQRDNAFSPWRPVFPTWQAETGYGHLRDVRHEGDGSTPTGVFPIGRTMYGNRPAPRGLHYAYHQLVCGDWWDEDPYSPRYNQFVHVTCGVTPSFASWSEALWTETRAYPYFAVLETNNNPTIGGPNAPGSGIFLHNWVGGATAGCVALPLANLLSVLGWLEPADHPVIEIGTDAEVGRVPAPAPPIHWSVARSPADGYWLASSAGTVTAFGRARHLASPATTGVRLSEPITAIASKADGKGYWVTSAEGQIFNYGDARWYGSPFHERRRLDLVGIAPTPGGLGYYVVTARGAVEAFGDARPHGEMAISKGATRIVSIAATPDGRGYWLLATDGTVHAYGDARWRGSPATSHLRLGSPLVGLVPTADGRGYWLATAAGRVLAFGDALLGGSPLGHLSSPVVAITALGSGYALYAAAPSLPARPTEYRYPASATAGTGSGSGAAGG